jgi:hypothetical protein
MCSTTAAVASTFAPRNERASVGHGDETPRPHDEVPQKQHVKEAEKVVAARIRRKEASRRRLALLPSTASEFDFRVSGSRSVMR